MNTDWRYLRIGCRGKYLDLRGSKEQENGEDCIIRNFISCTPGQILSGGSNWQGMQQARGKVDFIKCFGSKS
jgi:hypothetical protein